MFRPSPSHVICTHYFHGVWDAVYKCTWTPKFFGGMSVHVKQLTPGCFLSSHAAWEWGYFILAFLPALCSSTVPTSCSVSVTSSNYTPGSRPYSYQEHIEPAKPAREHVTTIDGEIQTWLPDTNFSNIQIWKGSNVRMHSYVFRVPCHGPRVNRGFNPIQQQPSHRSRQQRATHPRVLSFWTEKHLGLTRWKTVGVRKYPLIRNTLTRSNSPLLTPCSASLAKLQLYLASSSLAIHVI